MIYALQFLDAQYSYSGKLVKSSYASGKVVTLTHCEMQFQRSVDRKGKID